MVFKKKIKMELIQNENQIVILNPILIPQDLFEIMKYMK